MLFDPRRRAALTFAPTAVILLLGAFLFHVATVWRDTDRLVDRTWRADAVLRRTLSDLEDAESGQRGYLLTGDPVYLRPYEAAHRALVTDTVELRRALATLETPPSELDSLRSAIDQKLAELDQTVALRRAGLGERALAVVRTGRGQQLMARIRELGDRFRSARATRSAWRRGVRRCAGTRRG